MSWVKFPTSTGLWLWTEFDRTKKVWSDPQPVRVFQLSDTEELASLERLGSEHNLGVRPDPLTRWAPLNLWACPPSPPPEAEHQSIFEVTYVKNEVYRATYTLSAASKDEARSMAVAQHKKGKVAWVPAGSSEELRNVRLKSGVS